MKGKMKFDSLVEKLNIFLGDLIDLLGINPKKIIYYLEL
jgi:hypothetical protein